MLVTGAEGGLGRALVAALAAAGPVIAWVRAADPTAMAAKRAALVARLGPDARRVRLVGGDLARDDAFARVPVADVGAIVHTAACTRFSVTRADAAAVNVRGTERVLALARRCPTLARVVHCSSVYASGLATGAIAEAPLRCPPGFANHYEWSKWAGERAIERAPDVPVQRLRVGVVVAERPGGPVGCLNAVHETLRLYHRGWLRLVPGLRDTPLWLATTDLVVDAVRACLQGRLTAPIAHVVHDGPGAPRLADAIDAAFEVFEADPAFARRALPRPRFCDWERFDGVCRGVDGVPRLRRATACIAPFARQLYASKTLAAGALRAAGVTGPPLDGRRLFADVCRALVAGGWLGDGEACGAASGSRAGAPVLDRAAG